MKLTVKLVFVAVLISSITGCNTKKKHTAQSKNTSKIVVDDAWARPANKDANSAVYLTVANNTAQTDTLLGVESAIAKMEGIHQTYRNDKGMTGMKEAGAIPIKPNATFALKPGGYHIMLMNITRALQQGDSLQITLNFARTEAKTVTVPVKSMIN